MRTLLKKLCRASLDARFRMLRFEKFGWRAILYPDIREITLLLEILNWVYKVRTEYVV
jgi:hypothetical protein